MWENARFVLEAIYENLSPIEVFYEYLVIAVVFVVCGIEFYFFLQFYGDKN